MTVWVFGYGSLLWRRDFPSGPPVIAAVHGWERRLDQGSPDHRGTPEHLGRVATLVPRADAVCWGAVFAIADADAGHVLPALDHRERGGYLRLDLNAFPREAPGEPVRAVTWIASPDNPYYLGPASDAVIAARVREAVGPSGRNDEYVLRLAETLRAMRVEDPHVFAIERALRSQG